MIISDQLVSLEESLEKSDQTIVTKEKIEMLLLAKKFMNHFLQKVMIKARTATSIHIVKEDFQHLTDFALLQAEFPLENLISVAMVTQPQVTNFS